MQGYQGKGWSDDAKTYLNAHQDLKAYLDNAYKTLSPKMQYFTPDEKGQDTYNGLWANVSKASGTTGHFAEKMKDAGYEYDKATGTYRNNQNNAVFSIDPKGNLYRKDNEGAGTIKNKLEFDPKTNGIMWRSKATTPGTYNYSIDKKKALASNASKDWATIGETLKLKGKFYDTMLSKRFKYDTKSGEYYKDGAHYKVTNGQVRATDKGANYSHKISIEALKQLLGIQ